YRIAQSGLGLDAVITVVDVGTVDRVFTETVVAGKQVRAADFLVMNKTDLVDERGLARARKRIRRLNRRALTLECERGRVESSFLFGTAPRRYRVALGEGGPGAEQRSTRGHLDDEGISALSYRSGRQLEKGKFERLLGRLPDAVYRAKGIVRFRDHDWHCLFNFTCGRFELNWVRLVEEEPSQGVFIGRFDDTLRRRILKDLAGCEAE
ncbi:MAG: GTP-binding protein, partial [Candidatus Binatia bacterium]